MITFKFYCRVSSALNPELLHAVLREIAPLLSESDLHIAQLTLHLLTSVARKQQTALLAGGVGGVILTEVFTLLRSPLLQGVALLSLLEFLQALVEFNTSGIKWNVAVSVASFHHSTYLFQQVLALVTGTCLPPS